MRPVSMLHVFLALAVGANAQTSHVLPVKGYAKTSVNTVVFRGNSVVTHGSTQYTAFYDSTGKVVLAKRALGSEQWEVKTTGFTGTVSDAHNSISLGVDAAGIVHMAWNMHGTALNYAKGSDPGSLELARSAMLGNLESSVTYPQFFRRADGGLLFMYRDGSSGNGNLALNLYDAQTKTWKRLHDKLIDGEGARNAYWEAYLDESGVLHVGWVWRETSDVATNHDQCYARSRDGGLTWEKSTGQAYALPIRQSTAEIAWKVPQNRELINQTSIFGDEKGRAYIAAYWTDSVTGIPQYHLVWNDGAAWKCSRISDRKLDFSLSGGGTKRIPIARPQLVVERKGDSIGAVVVFRDQERGWKVSAYRTENLAKNAWTVRDLSDSSVGLWEPSYDPELWKTRKILGIFVQKSEQGDGETTVDLPAQPVSILEWAPFGGTSSVRPVLRSRPGAGRGWDALGRMEERSAVGSLPSTILLPGHASP
ncbi:MAG TPA: BNR repeat-containing protein [Fibrobacteria bacterium]|nr:BNR repeat-containing protein [Fibrobacteria bacterium]